MRSGSREAVVGSARYAAKASLIFALAALLGAAPASEKKSSRSETLASVEAIERWADKTFFGGHVTREFARDGKKVVVVLGYTGGMVSTEIVVFHRAASGEYRALLTRSRLYLAVRVVEDERGIVFLADEPILIIPWSGVIPDREQHGP
jgi:hypothetical protein